MDTQIQGVDLLRVLTLFVLIALSLLPSRSTDLKFIPIFKSLVVKIDRLSPARLAFLDAQLSYDIQSSSVINSGINYGVQLAAGTGDLEAILNLAGSNKIVLEPMTLSAPEGLRDQTWIQELSEQQKARLRVAENMQNTLSEHFSASLPSLPVENIEPDISKESEESKTLASSTFGRKIQGHIEITGGLAVTNDHHLEIRRRQEGIVKERGSVNLRDGTYEVAVEDFSGEIEARLVSESGHVLGEGRVLISALQGSRGTLTGPAIKVLPRKNFGGALASHYGNKGKAPAGTRVTMLKGSAEEEVGANGQFLANKVAANSTTVVRAAAPGYMQTASLTPSLDDNSLLELFPVSMMRALHGLVTGRTLLDADLANASVIWGVARLDGKPASGITVEIESAPNLKPIYFNSLLIPDPGLATTSDNGLYAFIDVEEGFHALRAQRGHRFFAYDNAVVELGSVALTSLNHSMKKHSVPVKAFNAFSGQPVDGTLDVQGVEEQVEILGGVSVAALMTQSKQGYIQFTSNSNDYISARYPYRDNDSFIHIPVIPWSWLLGAKATLRINEAPSSGVVVGFVPDFNFEVYVAGNDVPETVRIAYFDMAGRWTKSENAGVAGGGFAIFNLPPDVHEVVLVSKDSEIAYSQVIPVDANNLNVVTFRE